MSSMVKKNPFRFTQTKQHEYFEIEELLEHKKNRHVQTIGKIVLPSRSLQSIQPISKKNPKFINLDFEKLDTIPSEVKYVHVFGELICSNDSVNCIELECFNEFNAEADARQRQKLLNQLLKKTSLEFKHLVEIHEKEARKEKQEVEKLIEILEYLKNNQ